MGLFSLRKLDDHDNQLMTGTAEHSDKSVVKVLRSRFYGKKGKEKELPIIYIPQNASVAETLSAVGPSKLHVPAAPSPLAADRTITSRRAPSSRRVRHAAQDEHHLSTTLSNKPLPSTPDMRRTTPAGASSTRPRDENHAIPATPSSTPQRGATDTVTITLAQRLNELAAANAEGLLNDDEYRLLRQNLFERFATTSEVPNESPVVPAARPRPKPPGPHTPERMSSRPLSNFRVDLPRSPSTQSRSSIVSGVASLFRKTSITSGHRDSDAASIWSKASGASEKFRFSRILSRKSSSSSLHTTASRNPDTISISSRHGGGGVGHSHPETPRTPRRPLATPPSSFPTTLKQPEARHKGSIYDVFDEDHLSTAVEIRDEIRAVEAEVRRLMDAFNGLEMTTLSKAQRSRGYSVTQSEFGRGSHAGSVVESKWSADGRSTRRVNIAESDAGSVRSGTSAATGPAFSPRQTPRSKLGPGAPLSAAAATTAMNGTPSRPSSLRRRNSGSSNKSHSKRGKAGPAVPVPAIPSHVYISRTDPQNSSSVSLARSNNLMVMMSEDDSRSVAQTVATVTRLDDDGEEETEMEEIRRRREEVQMRYDARLDYLRAKLKSAELHEKLRRR